MKCFNFFSTSKILFKSIPFLPIPRIPALVLALILSPDNGNHLLIIYLAFVSDSWQLTLIFFPLILLKHSSDVVTPLLKSLTGLPAAYKI